MLWINWPLHDFLTGHMNVFMHFEVTQRFFRLWYFLLIYRASPYRGTYWCLSKVSYQTEDQWLTIVPAYTVILWLGRRKKQSFVAHFFIRNKILFKESEKVENRVQGVLWTRRFKQSLRNRKQPPNVEGKCVIDRKFTDHLPIFGLITSIFVGCRLLFSGIKKPILAIHLIIHKQTNHLSRTSKTKLASWYKLKAKVIQKCDEIFLNMNWKECRRAHIFFEIIVERAKFI